MTDAKRLVFHGYDQIADDYLARYGRSSVRRRRLAELLALLPHGGGARVLDLGCGAGVPVAQALSAAGHDVTGVDGSTRQISLARSNVPGAAFIEADMTEVVLPERGFDAAAAFYSITHVPRAEHDALFRRIARWLVPGGTFVASLGAVSSDDWRGEWMGTEMFFSHHDAEANLSLLRGAEFVIERAEVLDQDDEDGRFLWIVARRGDGEA